MSREREEGRNVLQVRVLLRDDPSTTSGGNKGVLADGEGMREKEREMEKEKH